MSKEVPIPYPFAAVGTRPRLLAAEDGVLHRYERTLLVDSHGTPIRAGALTVGQCYIFHYPYTVTPCFLLNLGRPVVEPQSLATEEGTRYRWEGGVGPQRSVVAFSAICAHKMTHPARAVSFINYRHEQVTFRNGQEESERRAQVIYCCSEKSVYDPLRGPPRQNSCRLYSSVTLGAER